MLSTGSAILLVSGTILVRAGYPVHAPNCIPVLAEANTGCLRQLARRYESSLPLRASPSASRIHILALQPSGRSPSAANVLVDVRQHALVGGPGADKINIRVRMGLAIASLPPTIIILSPQQHLIRSAVFSNTLKPQH